MSDQTADVARAESEAADWFGRLGRIPIATRTWQEFNAWRQSPTNATAYDALEARWRLNDKLINDPDVQALISETLKQLPARKTGTIQLNKPLLWGVGLVAGCALAGWVFLTLFPTYSTRVGEHRLVVLRDGSRVHLNTDSKLKVRFGLRERRVVLAKGEALFEVAHNPGSPFTVAAGDARIHDVGTRFDVRRQSGGAQITLLEGRVNVGHASGPNVATLQPNQQLTVTAERISVPSPVDGDQTTKWTTGQLVFRDVALAAAVEEVNRYTNRKIVLSAPADIAARPMSGSFDAGKPRGFVEAASNYFDLKADWSKPDEIRLAARSPGSSRFSSARTQGFPAAVRLCPDDSAARETRAILIRVTLRTRGGSP